MKAVILAAGRGSRMKGLTDDRPKCLVELAGRPLLHYQTAALRDGGCDGLGIVAGYRGELLEGRGLTVFTNPRWADTNMVVSLTRAGDWLAQGPCLVSYGDIFYSADTVRDLAAAAGDIAIAFDPDWHTLWSARFPDPLSDAETFRRDGDGNVADIGRRPSSLAEVEGQYMGLLKFTPAGWNRVCRHLDAIGPDAAARLDMTSLLRALVAGGLKLAAVPVRGRWGEVDSADDLALYEGWFPASREHA